jgi:hypothetical protein
VRPPEWIIGVAAMGLVLDVFLVDWYGSADAWSALAILRYLLVLTAIGGLATWWLQGSKGAPAAPVCATSIELFLASLLLIALVVRVVISPPGSGESVQAGAYLGLGLCAALAGGAYWSLRRDCIRKADGPQEIEVLAVEQPR